jgi:hypothetical protein
MTMLNKNDEQGDDQFFYDLDEAAEVVWENIPQTLRDKYAFGEIYFILETEFDYLDSIGIMFDEDDEKPVCEYPRDIDQQKMEKHILDTAIKNGILLSYDELGDILDAELIYYEMNGALGDAGEYLN